MNIKTRWKWTLVLAALLGVHTSVWAHNMRMSVYIEGNNLEGEIYYVGGGNAAASGAAVDLITSGDVIATTTTDQDGLFVFSSVSPADYLVRGDAGQGHVATFDVKKNEFIGIDSSTDSTQNKLGEDAASVQSAPGEINAQQLQVAITKAIRPLREQIDLYEAKTRFHDILGGIGYVFGLFGLLVLIKQRRQLWT